MEHAVNKIKKKWDHDLKLIKINLNFMGYYSPNLFIWVGIIICLENYTLKAKVNIHKCVCTWMLYKKRTTKKYCVQELPTNVILPPGVHLQSALAFFVAGIPLGAINEA